MSAESPTDKAYAGLADRYREHLEHQVLPFWLDHGVDGPPGGFLTCFENRGRVLASTDKYTWSQGRFLWVLARAVELGRRGLVRTDVDRCLSALEDGIRFVLDHVVRTDGGKRPTCVYLTDRSGEPREPWPGSGHDVSIFADCFVVLGLAEAARVLGDDHVLGHAATLLDSVGARMAEGATPTEPYPVPAGYAGWNVPMIALNAAQETARALETADHPRATEVRARSRALAGSLAGRIADGEAVPPDLLARTSQEADTVLARHRTPGHVVEAACFVLAEARRAPSSDPDAASWIDAAGRVIVQALRLGWDDEHGGLLRYVDVDGGQPTGRSVESRYESLIRRTWDTKLWWPHAEALYATASAALCCRNADRAASLWSWHRRLGDYALTTFPDPDGAEWIQNRDRAGVPIDEVVALPVKDPFHVTRALLLLVESLQEDAK